MRLTQIKGKLVNPPLGPDPSDSNDTMNANMNIVLYN